MIQKMAFDFYLRLVSKELNEMSWHWGNCIFSASKIILGFEKWQCNSLITFDNLISNCFWPLSLMNVLKIWTMNRWSGFIVFRNQSELCEKTWKCFSNRGKKFNLYRQNGMPRVLLLLPFENIFSKCMWHWMEHFKPHNARDLVSSKCA